ncbi:MAG TPA: helix-turn-helix domain-containing protein [Variovorax sp.]|jgi:transcriptional regulator GlxA family with amidase domain
MPITVHFDLLLPKGGMPGALWAAVDTLRELNALARLRAPREPGPVASWRVLDDQDRTHRQHALTCVDGEERRASRRHAEARWRVLLVPALEMRSIHALHRLVQRNPDALALVRRAFDGGAFLGACGTGTWLLAHAGVISEAPVPWLYQSGFAKFYPGVRIESREPLLAMHRSVCAATPSLAHSLVVHLIRYAGLADLAHAVAEKLLLNAERQNLSAAMSTDQIMRLSRDVPLFRAQSWMQAHASRPFLLREAADAAAVSERTLNRLFQQHLGKTPLQYAQQVRLQRAQMWLEGTWRSVEEIAHDCGYIDSSAFCRMFRRAAGVSPQSYRERYNFRGPRALWRAPEAQASVE